MDEFFARWGANNEGLLDNWYAEGEIMREFARNRAAYIQGYIVEQFGLSGTSTLTVNIEYEKGYIRINSLDIDHAMLEMENAASWSGTYFNDVPITIDALPQPGFSFSHWEGLDASNPEIEITLSSDLYLKPVFIPN